MAHAVTVYWSFRSPYSYLATGRLRDLARDYDVDLKVAPVLPLAVRDDSFFERANPLFLRYLLRDVVRVAEMQGIPLGWPDPDPIVQDMGTGTIAKDQPHIFHLTRLGVEAVLSGHGLAFIDEVSRLIWGGTVKGWNEGRHLAEAAARAGLDLAEMEAKVTAAPDRYDRLIEENQQALNAAGHWGVPTMVLDGEPFFGQDRINVLIWRLNRKGLKKN